MNTLNEDITMKTVTFNTNEENTMNNFKNSTETTTNQEENIMNLFSDIAVPVQENKKPIDWTLEDCKNNLKVIFRECSDPDCFIVSINLGGLTSLKVFEGKTTFKMKKGLMEKEEMLARVKNEDSVIEEARERLLQSLRKAKQSREATKVKKQRELESLYKQQMNKLSKLQQRAVNESKKEALQERIDIASLMSEVEEIESNQALTQLLSI